MSDPWARLRGTTPARIGLGRAGVGLTTRTHLEFSLDHARARDAVHRPFDSLGVAARLGSPSASVLSSAARDRAEYLRRPDLGRRLSESSARLLGESGLRRDIAVIVGDGLSPRAAERLGPPLARLLAEGLGSSEHVALFVAEGARVALGDAIGETIGARLSIVLLGERPGLSVPESLGAYLTFAPKVGRSDAERNCVSNVHDQGLSVAAAAQTILWLARAALARGLTGVELKDESPAVADGTHESQGRLPSTR